MTYDPSLPTDTHKVRYLVGDTDVNDLMLQDDEIAWLLQIENDDVFMAAARACESIAARFARDVNYRFSTMWQDSSDAFAHYMKLAETLRASDEADFPNLGFKASATFDDVGPENFWYGMHDNPPRVRPTDTE